MIRIPISSTFLKKRKGGANGYFVYFKEYSKESANGDAVNEMGEDQKAVKRKANTDTADYGGKKSKQDSNPQETGRFLK